MKKISSKIISIFMAALILISTISLVVTANAAAAPTLSAKTLTVTVGKTATLKMKNTKAKVTWATSNKRIATVSSNGIIKGIKVGKVNITATANKKKYVCKVTVKKAATPAKKPTPKPTKKPTHKPSRPVVKVSSIRLNLIIPGQAQTSTKTMDLGKTGNIIATVMPTNATNKTMVWKTSNAKVVSIDTNGKVSATGVGTAKITATAADGSKKTASMTITVKKPIIKVTSVNVGVGAGYSSTILDNKGQTYLTASVKPYNASNTNVTWKSSNSSIASVDRYGYVTGKKAGKVTITATAADGSKKFGTIEITVNAAVSTKVTSVSVAVAPGYSNSIYDNNGTTRLIATVFPSNASVKAVTWKSSKPSVASVDDNGNVTALKAGTATITATATDGSRKYGSTKITVLQTGEVSVSKIANRTQLNVKNALKALGFSIVVDPQSSNSCDGTIRAIILSENSDSYVYHELGHFLAYVSENADKSSDFISIYNTEKGKYTGAQNRVANVSEYFAQSYEEYTKSTATANALRRERPLTYNYIKNCISNLSKLMKDASFTQMNLAGLRYNCGK